MVPMIYGMTTTPDPYAIPLSPCMEGELQRAHPLGARVLFWTPKKVYPQVWGRVVGHEGLSGVLVEAGGETKRIRRHWIMRQETV